MEKTAEPVEIHIGAWGAVHSGSCEQESPLLINAYAGTWSFTAYNKRTVAGGFYAWLAAPYTQDARSAKS